MTVEELIAELSKCNLSMPVLIKSFRSEKESLTLFEEIVAVKKEVLFEGDSLQEAVVVTPTFANRSVEPAAKLH